MPRVRVPIVLTVLALGTGVAAGDPVTPAENVRPMQPWIAEALAYGAQASHTLAQLVGEVAATSMIVHIEEASGPRQGWDGRIRFVSTSGPWLFLRIDLRRHDVATAAAIVAHELQHALEVHAGGVRSAAEFEAFYRRTGVRNASGTESYDTPAAVAAGERTLRELALAAVLSGAGAAVEGCRRQSACCASRRGAEVARRLRGCRGDVMPPP